MPAPKIPAVYGNWLGIPLGGFPATDVAVLYQHYFGMLYNAASSVIVINGIDTIETERDYFFQCLLLIGNILFFKKSGKVYAIHGNPAGQPDAFRNPTKLVYANTVLGSGNLTEGKDGVLVYLTPSDRLFTFTNYGGGLYSLIASTAQLLADNTSSINCAQINGRVQTVFTSESNQEAKSAEVILKDMYAGKPYRVIPSEILSKFQAQPIAQSVTSTMLMELVELRQYILAQFWNSIGLDANFNMKRERLITAEVEANSAALKVPIQTILDELNEGFENVRKAFDVELHAELNPEYKKVIEATQQNGIDTTKEGDDNNGKEREDSETGSSGEDDESDK